MLLYVLVSRNRQGGAGQAALDWQRPGALPRREREAPPLTLDREAPPLAPPSEIWPPFISKTKAVGFSTGLL